MVQWGFSTQFGPFLGGAWYSSLWLNIINHYPMNHDDPIVVPFFAMANLQVSRRRPPTSTSWAFQRTPAPPRRGRGPRGPSCRRAPLEEWRAIPMPWPETMMALLGGFKAIFLDINDGGMIHRYQWWIMMGGWSKFWMRSRFFEQKSSRLLATSWAEVRKWCLELRESSENRA